MVDENLSSTSALFKDPKSKPFELIYFITLNLSIAITPLSPRHYLFSIFHIREWRLRLCIFNTLRPCIKIGVIIGNEFVCHTCFCHILQEVDAKGEKFIFSTPLAGVNLSKWSNNVRQNVPCALFISQTKIEFFWR